MLYALCLKLIIHELKKCESQIGLKRKEKTGFQALR
jgi:hypothetical protein